MAEIKEGMDDKRGPGVLRLAQAPFDYHLRSNRLDAKRALLHVCQVYEPEGLPQIPEEPEDQGEARTGRPG